MEGEGTAIVGRAHWRLCFFLFTCQYCFPNDIGFRQEHGVVEFQISFFVVMRSFVVRCPRKSGGRIGSVRQFASMLRDVVVDDLN